MPASFATPLTSSVPSPAELLNPHTQSVFDGTPNGLVIVDHQRKIAHSNRAANTLFQWTEPMRGESAEFLFANAQVPPPSSGRVSATLHLPLDEGLQIKDEPLRRQDGSEFTAQIDVSPLETTEGVWYIATIADLTEQKQLESTVRLSRQQLQEFFEVAPQAVIAFEADGSIVSANSNAARLFGYDAGQLMGLPMEQFTSPLPAIGVTQQQHARKRNGATFPIEITGASLPMHDGSRTVALITDLSERKKLERSLEEVTSQLLTLVGANTPGAKPEKSKGPLDELGGRDFLAQFLATVSTASAGWNVIVFTVRHHKVLSDRLGKGVADRLVEFAAAYIKQSLTGATDNLFYWGGATMVATLKRDAISDARQEASDISGRRLEHLMERGGGGTAMVLISLASSTFSLEGLSEDQMFKRIDAAALQGAR